MVDLSLKCLSTVRIQFIVLCGIYFLFRTGISMFETIIGPYLIRIVCEKRFLENKTLCAQLSSSLEDEVRKDASLYFTLYRLFINIPSIFSGLLCGVWSDKNGRKIPMILPCVGIIFSAMCFTGSMYMGSNAVWIALLGTLIQSMFGNTIVFGMAVNACTAELSDSHQRTKQISIISAFSQFGKSLGAFLAGILGWNLLISYGTVIAIYCLTLMIIVMFFRKTEHGKTEDDSKQTVENQTTSCSRSSLPDAIRSYLALVVDRRSRSVRALVVAYLCLAIIYGCDINGVDDILLMYVTATPFSWSNSQYSYYVGLRNISTGLLLLVILPLLSHQLKLSDSTLIVIGVLGNISRYAGTGLSNRSLMIYALLTIWPLPFVIRPCLWSILSKSVNENELGKLYSLYSIIDTISKIVGSIVYVNLYGATVALLPSITFFVMGAVNLILLFAVIAMNKCRGTVGSYIISESRLSNESEMNKNAHSDQSNKNVAIINLSWKSI